MKPSKPSGIFFFLPAIVLIAFFGFGAGTALAHSGPGAWNINTNPTQVFSNPNQAPVVIGPLDGAGGLSATLAATGAKRRAFVGTVDSITGAAVYSVTGSAVVLILQGTDAKQTIFVPDSVEIKMPGGLRAGEFEVDARVVILTKMNGSEFDRVALRVLVKPEKPMYAHYTGVVTAVDDGVVTVESPDGDVQTLTLPDDAEDVVPGEVITVFEGSGKVTGLVRAAQVQDRLNRFLEDAGDEEGDEESSDDTGQRSRRADALARVSENFGARHLEVLSRVAARVPERVRLQIETIKARVESGRRHTQAIIQRVTAKLQGRAQDDDPPGNGNLRPVGKGKPVDNAGGQSQNRSSGAGEGDGSGTAGPRINGQGDADGSDTPEDGKRPGFRGKGKS